MAGIGQRRARIRFLLIMPLDMLLARLVLMCCGRMKKWNEQVAGTQIALVKVAAKKVVEYAGLNIFYFMTQPPVIASLGTEIAE